TRRLFPVANTPAAIAALGEEGLKRYISTIGLYNAKAANVVAMAKLLIERHGGEVPRTRAELEALPGVGRKTANVVLNTAFGEPVMAVDTHIFRVSNRTGLAHGRNVRAVEDRLLKRVPADYLLDAHHWLILHGRYVCKARRPECGPCVIRDLCTFPDKTPVDVTAAIGTPADEATPGVGAPGVGPASARRRPGHGDVGLQRQHRLAGEALRIGTGPAAGRSRRPGAEVAHRP